MIIKKMDFLYRSQIDEKTLEICLQEEWIVPEKVTNEPAFTEADVARAKLIRDLKHDLGVNDEGVGVILNLLDQVHSLRKVLGDVLQASRKDPPPTNNSSQ